MYYVTFNKRKGIVKVRAKKLNGFSLMEMMVVLLIVAIIAAASAPMVTKKLSRSAGTNDSPWVFTGLNNSIAYNMNGNDNTSAIIGSADVNRSAGQPMPKLYIESSGNEPQLGFGSQGQEGYVSLLIDRNNRRVAFSNAANIPSDSVAIGVGQTISNSQSVVIGISARAFENTPETVAIGYRAHTEGRRSIAIGSNNAARAEDAIAIGGEETYAYAPRSLAIGRQADTASLANNSIALGCIASTEEAQAIAIGYGARASGASSIAIGSDENFGNSAKAEGENSIAVGNGATASHDNSVAIGAKAKTTKNDEIVLGTKEDTVYIPGNLVVGRRVLLNRETAAYHTTINPWGHNGNWFISTEDSGCDRLWAYLGTNEQAEHHALYVHYSDRRLKNVGEKYTAGLSELKKLDFFHYTFKDDKEKTPHVGVMAQDLQKVFPDAVTKGEDGYLRIRLEDMFYAVINAVKELDNKIAEIVQNITDINSTIEKQNKTIEEQQKTIDELVKRIEKLEKQK